MKRASNECIIAAYCVKCGRSGLLLGQSNQHFCTDDSSTGKEYSENDGIESNAGGKDPIEKDPKFTHGTPITETQTIIARRIYLPALLAGYNDFRDPVRKLASNYRTIYRTVGTQQVIASMTSITSPVSPSPSELAWEKLQLQIFDLADFHLTPDQMIRKFDDMYRKSVK